MSAISKLLAITSIVLLPWAIIRLTNLETKILDFLNTFDISDAEVIVILITPLLIFWAVKWLFEPASNTHRSYSVGEDLLVKFRK
jgi:hypothetical protein